MITINATTKRGAAFIESYNRSADSCLWDVYGRFSVSKSRAEALCKRQMENEGGQDFRILSANSFHFTCGWRVPDGLRVETAQYSYIVK